MTESLSTTLAGRVAAVNDKGIRLDGSDGWLNYSKYAVGLVAPTKGDDVVVTLDRAGFVRSVTRVDGSVAPVAGASDAPAPSRSAPTDKDRTITRLAVLKAAAEFGAARPSLKSGDVLKIAVLWERWVLRDESLGVVTDDDEL